MSDRLDELIEPLLLAAKGRTLKGRIPLAQLGRLVPSLYGTEGFAEAELRFDRDEVGLPCIKGRINALLTLQCQRCMQAMTLPLTVEVSLGIVTSKDAAEKLPENYDPLLVTAEPMKVADIVEDELILALPLVAMHEIKDCPSGERFQRTEEETAEPARENPFAILAELKKDKD
jgi:uncharacterized protein